MEYSPGKTVKSLRIRILAEMRAGLFAQAERLPSENVLAQLLGISRTQLRDTLASLEREGFISRRHGIGTVINRHVLSVANRMDLEIEFMDMVALAGYQPGIAFTQASKLPAEAAVAARLNLRANQEVMRIDKLVTADGRGAIYCKDYFDCGMVKDASYTADVFDRPIFYFFNKYCGREPFMDLTEVRAAAADADLAALLGVDEGAPLLYMDELDYDIEGRPMLYSQQYYVDGLIRHTVLRKKI